MGVLDPLYPQGDQVLAHYMQYNVAGLEWAQLATTQSAAADVPKNVQKIFTVFGADSISHTKMAQDLRAVHQPRSAANDISVVLWNRRSLYERPRMYCLSSSAEIWTSSRTNFKPVDAVIVVEHIILNKIAPAPLVSVSLSIVCCARKTVMHLAECLSYAHRRKVQLQRKYVGKTHSRNLTITAYESNSTCAGPTVQGRVPWLRLGRDYDAAHLLVYTFVWRWKSRYYCLVG